MRWVTMLVGLVGIMLCIPGPPSGAGTSPLEEESGNRKSCSEWIRYSEYTAALGLLQAGDLRLAERQYRRFLKRCPDAPRRAAALFGLAETFYRRERYAPAARWYLRTLNAPNGTDTDARIAYERGLSSALRTDEEFLQQRYLSQAERDTRPLLTEKAARRIGRVMRERGEVSRALRWAQGRRVADPGSEYWLHETALLLAMSGRGDEALPLLQALLRGSQSYRNRALYLRAEIRLQNRRLASAESDYRQLRSANGFRAEALYGLAWVSIYRGNLERARHYLDRVLGLSEGNMRVRAARDRARLARRQDRHVQTEYWYLKAIGWAGEPTRSDLRRELGDYLFDRGRPTEAAIFYERVEGIDRTRFRRMIDVMLSLGRFKRAQQLLRSRGTEDDWSEVKATIRKGLRGRARGRIRRMHRMLQSTPGGGTLRRWIVLARDRAEEVGWIPHWYGVLLQGTLSEREWREIALPELYRRPGLQRRYGLLTLDAMRSTGHEKLARRVVVRLLDSAPSANHRRALLTRMFTYSIEQGHLEIERVGRWIPPVSRWGRWPSSALGVLAETYRARELSRGEYARGKRGLLRLRRRIPEDRSRLRERINDWLADFEYREVFPGASFGRTGGADPIARHFLRGRSLWHRKERTLALSEMVRADLGSRLPEAFYDFGFRMIAEIRGTTSRWGHRSGEDPFLLVASRLLLTRASRTSTRVQAVRGLLRFPERGFSPLVEMLGEPDSEVELEVLRTLREERSGVVSEWLTKRAEAASGDERRRVLRVLERIDPALHRRVADRLLPHVVRMDSQQVLPPLRSLRTEGLSGLFQGRWITGYNLRVRTMILPVQSSRLELWVLEQYEGLLRKRYTAEQAVERLVEGARTRSFREPSPLTLLVRFRFVGEGSESVRLPPDLDEYVFLRDPKGTQWVRPAWVRRIRQTESLRSSSSGREGFDGTVLNRERPEVVLLYGFDPEFSRYEPVENGSDPQFHFVLEQTFPDIENRIHFLWSNGRTAHLPGPVRELVQGVEARLRGKQIVFRLSRRR